MRNDELARDGRALATRPLEVRVREALVGVQFKHAPTPSEIRLLAKSPAVGYMASIFLMNWAGDVARVVGLLLRASGKRSINF